MQKIRFGIVGSGWRAMTYANIARLAPERFALTGVTSRTPEIEKPWVKSMGIPVFASWQELAEKTRPDFLVSAVGKKDAGDVLAQIAGSGMPVLAETFLLADEAALFSLWERAAGGPLIQVAEQFHLQPMAVARRRAVELGLLGEVVQAQVSVSQTYHGISLLRKYLGIDFADATVQARSFILPTQIGPDKNGDPASLAVSDYPQTVAWFDFGSKSGIFDNVREQQFSWFRFQRLLIRGVRGEILNERISFAHDLHTPVSMAFTRRELGQDENLEGAGLRSIMLGERCLYENPLPSSRLTDDELAVACLLANMGDCLQGGAAPLYPLAQSLEDQYLAVLMARAVKTGAVQRTADRPWKA